jgi:beta-mannosidase
MSTQVKELFGNVPDTVEDFVFASQAAQAEAKKFFIEFFRSGKWRRTGILWWNLLDGWPQLSDAVVDYYWRRKMAFDFICRAQQPLLLVLREPAGRKQELVACNDTRDDVIVTYVVRDVAADEVVAEGQGTAAGDAVTELTRIAYDEKIQRFYLLEWQTPDGSGRSHYLAGKPPFDLEEYRTWIGDIGEIVK